MILAGERKGESVMSDKCPTCGTNLEPPKSYKKKLHDEAIGYCLNCKKRITLCGRGFTAEIACHKCLYINVFSNSQQPVRGHW